VSCSRPRAYRWRMSTTSAAVSSQGWSRHSTRYPDCSMANRCRASSTESWNGIVDFTVLCDPPCSKDDPAGSALPVSVGDNAVLPSDLGVVDCRAHYWVKSAAWKIVQLLPVYPTSRRFRAAPGLRIRCQNRKSRAVTQPRFLIRASRLLAGAT
jgi:hypothetical protein